MIANLLKDYFHDDNLELERFGSVTNTFRYKDYFIKIFYKKFKSPLNALKEEFSEKHYIRVKKDIYILVEPFKPGDELKDDISLDTCNFINDLKKIHNHKLKEKDVYSILKKEAILLTKDLPIKGLQEIIGYIKNYNFPKANVLIHEDIQPKNIFVIDHKLHLFDYENGRPGHPYDDFSYLFLFSEQYPHLLKKIIDDYFDGNIPEDFDDLMSHFVILRYLNNLAFSYQNFPKNVLDNNAAIMLEKYVRK